MDSFDDVVWDEPDSGQFDDVVWDDAPEISSSEREETDGDIARGWEALQHNASIVGNAVTGDKQGVVDNILAFNEYNKANPESQDRQDFNKEWAEVDGFWDGVGTLATNIPALIDIGQETLPLMGATIPAMAAGTALGAAAGTAVATPVIGTAIGGAIGGWQGSAAVMSMAEYGSNVTQDVNDYLAKNGLESNADNISKALDTGILDKNVLPSLSKGQILGLVDLIGLKASALIKSGKPARELEKAITKEADKLGISVTEAAKMKSVRERIPQDLIDAANKQVSKATQVGRGAGAVGVGGLSEGGGEYLGQGLAYDEWDAKNAVLEGVVGLGAEAGQVGLSNIALGTSKLKDAAKDVVARSARDRVRSQAQAEEDKALAEIKETLETQRAEQQAAQVDAEVDAAVQEAVQDTVNKGGDALDAEITSSSVKTQLDPIVAQAHGTVEDNKKRLAETIARRQKQLKVDIDSQADALDQAMGGMVFDSGSLNLPANKEVKQSKTTDLATDTDNQLSPVKEASLNKKQKESRERSLKEAEQREQSTPEASKGVSESVGGNQQEVSQDIKDMPIAEPDPERSELLKKEDAAKKKRSNWRKENDQPDSSDMEALEAWFDRDEELKAEALEAEANTYDHMATRSSASTRASFTKKASDLREKAAKIRSEIGQGFESNQPEAVDVNKQSSKPVEPQKQDVINDKSFTPTHELADGTQVVAVEERNVYVGADGVEIEDNYATPIKPEPKGVQKNEENAQKDAEATNENDSKVSQQDAAQTIEKSSGDSPISGEAALEQGASDAQPSLKKTDFLKDEKGGVSEATYPKPQTQEELAKLNEGDIYTATDKEGNTTYLVRSDSPRGAGDTIHRSEEEAVKQASLNKKQKESRERSLKEAEQREQVEAQDKEKQDDIDGFLDDSKPMVRGRAVKSLNKQVRYNGNVATLKSHVKKLVEDGAELSIEEVDKIKPMSRAAFNRATSEQQQAHEEKIKKGGKKKVYYIGDVDLGKTAYDYATHLQSISGASKSDKGGNVAQNKKETAQGEEKPLNTPKTKTQTKQPEADSEEGASFSNTDDVGGEMSFNRRQRGYTRADIDAAEIKTKETDKGVALYSKGKGIPTVAKLTGGEIDLSLGAYDAAKEYYRSKLQNTSVATPIGDVNFTGKGWKEYKNGLKVDTKKAQLIPAVKSILSDGVYHGREPLYKKRNDDIVAFHFFTANVVIDGEVIQAGVSVGENSNGKLFYNLNHDTDALWDKRTKGLSESVVMRHGTKPLKSVTDDDLNITILSINGKVNALSKSQATTELRKDKRLAKAMDKGLLEVVNSESDIPMGAELFHMVWHGSPHDHNKFDSSKIGTGEGAQAYGYGLYFAGKKAVAEHYRDALTRHRDSNIILDGQPLTHSRKMDERSDEAIGAFNAISRQGGVDAAIDWLIARNNHSDNANLNRQRSASINWINDNRDRLGYEATEGVVYQVDLAPSQDEYLLWDKPLSEQSDLVKGLIDASDISEYHNNENTTGEDYYKYLSDNGINNQDASNTLHSLGIRGIKYLDGNSRGGGGGDYNYVIFDDADIEITAKYSKGEQVVQGATLNGKAYVVADGNTKDTVNSTAWHELTHAAMSDSDFMNSEQRSKLLKRLSNQRRLNKNNKFWQDVEQRVKDADTAPEHVLDEIAGYAVTEYLNGNKNLPTGLVKWVKELIAAIKAVIFKHTGIQFGKVSPQDLMAMTQSYVDFATKGERKVHGGTGDTVLNSIMTKFNTFFSGMGEAIDSKVGKSVNAKMLATQLQNPKLRGKWGIKEEEVEWTGIVEWLQEQDGKVTKQEIQDFIEANQVQVEEVELGIKGIKPFEWKNNNGVDTLEGKSIGGEPVRFHIQENYEGDGFNLFKDDSIFDEDIESIAGAKDIAEGELSYIHDDTSRYKDYTAKGEAENYRELLLTLPSKKPTLHEFIINKGLSPRTESKLGNLDAHKAEYTSKYGEQSDGKDRYISSHFDEKNILAHVRFDERIDADGKKVLFINEVQSDWHQEGRKKGYKEYSKEKHEKLREQVESKGAASLSDEDLTLWNKYQNNGKGNAVPNAPFKGNAWVMLAMKRMIRHAAENGFDKVAWATGEQSAELYSLDKTLSVITYQKGIAGPDLYSVSAKDLSGRVVVLEMGKPIERIAEVLGKEMAEKIANGEGVKSKGGKDIKGDGLKVGGEGMRGFYDKTLPALVNKYIKKWGAKVGEVKMDETQHGFDVTDAMRESAMRGQPLFSRESETAQAHKVAQRNAALPVSEGGLGLPANNTAMDRAKAMGFDVDTTWYHGTGNDFDSFKTDLGGVYFTDSSGYADRYTTRNGEEGRNIIPAYLKLESTFDTRNARHRKIYEDKFIGKWGNGTPLREDGLPDWVESLDFQEFFEGEGLAFDSAIVGEPPTTMRDGSFKPESSLLVMRGEQIRSINAAFDPMKKDRPEILFSKKGKPGGSDTNGAGNYSEGDSSNFAIPDETWKTVAIRKLQDKFKVLKDLQANIIEAGGVISEKANAYIAEELFHGKSENDIKEMREKYVVPLTEKMAEFGITQEELDKYLIALHAEERNKHIAEINPKFPDGGSGMKTKDANDIIKSIQKQGLEDDYKELASIVHSMLKNRREIIRDGGLEEDGLIDAWEDKYENYVPLKGFAEDEKNDSKPRTGQGYNIGGKESKRALGRSSEAASPSSFAIIDLTETLIRARKNEVGNALLQLIQDNPNPEYWSVYTDENPDMDRRIVKVDGKEVVKETAIPMAITKDRYFTTKKDGKTYYMKLEDKRLMDAMKNLGVTDGGKVIQTLGSITRIMSALNTSYSPEFITGNFLRDVQTAVLNLQSEQSSADGKIKGEKIAKRTAKDIPIAMKAVYASLSGKALKDEKGKEFQKWFEEFKQAGAKTGWFDMKDIDGQVKEIESLIEMANGTTKGKVMKWGKSAANFVENMNAAVENAVRLSAYVNARRAGISEQKAASLAKNMTVNFNRKGEVAATLNALFMFSNASIQGVANFARTMGTLKGDKSLKWQNLNNAQKLAVGMAAGSFFIAMANRAAAGDDDDGENWFDKVPDYVKERNIVIMKSLFGGEQDGTYWKIPLPYGYNIFNVIGDGMESAVFSEKKISNTAGRLALATFGSFSPIGFQDSQTFTGGVLKNATPTVIKPITDIALNENFFGSSIYTENFPFGTPKPDSALARRSTPEAYRKVAEWLNETTGGSRYRSGVVDINPDVMRYVADYFGGAAYEFFGSKTPDVIHRLASGVEIEPNQMLFTSRISGKVMKYDDMSKFYERRDKVNQLKAEYKTLSSSERREFNQEYGRVIRLDSRIKATEKKLKLLRKRRNRVYENDDLSFADRDRKLKDIQEQMNTYIDRVNKAYISASRNP